MSRPTFSVGIICIFNQHSLIHVCEQCGQGVNCMEPGPYNVDKKNSWIHIICFVCDLWPYTFKIIFCCGHWSVHAITWLALLYILHFQHTVCMIMSSSNGTLLIFMKILKAITCMWHCVCVCVIIFLVVFIAAEVLIIVFEHNKNEQLMLGSL